MLCFQAYNRLRYLQQTKTKILRIASAKEAASQTNNQINQAIRKHFSSILSAPPNSKGKTKQLSAGNLRAAYGKIAAHLYCPEECEPILYVGKILGHQCENYSTESLATTIHYYTYRIVNEENEIATKVPDCKRSGEEVTNPVSKRSGEEVTKEHLSKRPTDEVIKEHLSKRPTDEVIKEHLSKRPTEKVIKERGLCSRENN